MPVQVARQHLAHDWGHPPKAQALPFGPHHLFKAGDHHQSFDHVFDGLTLLEEPGFNIRAPARIEPSLAPAGQGMLTVPVPVGHVTARVPRYAGLPSPVRNESSAVTRARQSRLLNRLET